MNDYPRPDLDEIRRTYNLFVTPGGVTELRGVHYIDRPAPGRREYPGTLSGYYDDPEAFAREAAQASPKAGGTYFMLNPIKREYLARRHNRTAVVGEGDTTQDSGIVCRRFLPIDLDPVRLAKISATDSEKAQAMQRIAAVETWLTGTFGFPEPIRADGGNSSHLLYCIDLPNDDPSRDLISNCLEAIDIQFGDDSVSVDTGNFNASRIWKCYGTLARKGDHTIDRPHRLSRILHVPDAIEIVPVEQLQALADTIPPPEAATPNETAKPNWKGRTGSFDVEDFMARHGIDALRKGAWGQAQKWLLTECPFNPEHNDKSAVIVRFPDGRLGFKCHHNSCKGRAWGDLRDLLEPDRHRATADYPAQREPAAGYSANSANPEGPALPAKLAPKLDSSAEDDGTDDEFPQRPVCRDEAFHGALGKLAKDVEPYTEADKTSILTQSLITAGAIVGRGPWFRASRTYHHANEFLSVVGDTGFARKGTGLDISHDAMTPSIPIDEHGNPTQGDGWTFPQVVKGTGSGEGLIYSVRDPVFKSEPVRGPSPGKGQKGPIIDYEKVMVDEGVEDKRFLLEETEFSRVLKVASREGNTLSELLRQMWESGDLRNTVKGSPYRATGAHGAVIAHITSRELHKLLTAVEMSNGFTNRFLWIVAHKTKDLPDGDELDQVDFAPFRKAFTSALNTIQAAKADGSDLRMRRTDLAKAAWRAVYPLLNSPNPNVPSAVQGRGTAHALRLSMIYALVDGTLVIDAPHVLAALALWEYVEASARLIFGVDEEDPKARRLLDALKRAKDTGLSRDAISHDVFQGHETGKVIDTIVRQLCEKGRAEIVKQQTGGRPRSVVRIPPSDKSDKSDLTPYVDIAKEAISNTCDGNTGVQESATKVRSKCDGSPEQNSSDPSVALRSHLNRKSEIDESTDNSSSCELTSLKSLKSHPSSVEKHVGDGLEGEGAVGNTPNARDDSDASWEDDFDEEF
jgi:hypothetical protein